MYSLNVVGKGRYEDNLESNKMPNLLIFVGYIRSLFNMQQKVFPLLAIKKEQCNKMSLTHGQFLIRCILCSKLMMFLREEAKRILFLP